jgi:diguanylate cyclase (GGDEF)-like protein
MLVALPLLLIIQPKISNLFSYLFTIIYLILSYIYKNAVFEIDLLNCSIILLFNLFIGSFFYNTRKEEFILRQKYKHLSGIDELTELSNRRQFNINFEKNFYKSLNEKKTIALFLVDIDDFKNYNDYYGHLGGDDCLKKIGKFFKQFSEKENSITFYRFGGEEFIGIANNIDKEHANNIADNLIKGVTELNIKHASSRICDQITISVGAVIQYPSVLSNSSDFINLADKALYKVKANGKNGFLFY